MRTNKEEIQIEETIRLIKADLRRIEDNQYGTINTDVTEEYKNLVIVNEAELEEN